MMKKIKYMRFVVMTLIILFSCSIYNISANENTDDIVQEKIDVSENIVEEFGEEQENPELFSNVVCIDWTIKNGVRKKTKKFYKKKGSRINIDLNIRPATKSVRVGYLDADGEKTYKTVKGQIDYDFTVLKTGYVQVFVENSSGKTVTASGTYIK